MRKLFVVFGLFFLFLFPSYAFADYPNYQGYVNDFAKVLSSEFVDRLNTKLLAFDKQTSNQIAVVTVGTTSPETIEDYSIHLAEKWKVGQKGKDNGIIMLFAMRDRTMRIEVGRGLEGDIADVQTKHIQTDIIVPEFKKGNYEVGIDKGVNTVIATISHTATLSATPTSAVSKIPDIAVFIFVIILITILFIAISPWTPLGGFGTWGPTVFWGPGRKSDDDGFGGFGGGGFSGGGSSSNW